MGYKIIDKLYDVLEQRKDADPESSHTARLYALGTAKIAQKVGEEAVETAIEAVRGDKAALKEESVDLLFHLMVLWCDQGVKPKEVFKILENRFGLSGIDEKKKRRY